MSEEKKEEKAPQPPAEPSAADKPKEEVKVAQAPSAPAPAASEAQSAAAAPATVPPPAEAKKEAEPVKKEKPTNCAKCNKPIRKKQHYYRNGKFYCTKRCWKSTLGLGAKPAEAVQQEAK